MEATGRLHGAHTLEEFEIENEEFGTRIVGDIYFVLEARETITDAPERDD